jgi:GNAT superfamily N-acetyltransferase
LGKDGGDMKILLDTNILVPLEPTSVEDAEHSFSALAMDMTRLANEQGHQLFYHPLTKTEISNDKNKGRSALRLRLLSKYSELINPPSLLGEAAGIGGHDRVDRNLLLAVEANAVDYLVTQDKKMVAQSESLGIRDRVFSLLEAIEHLLVGKHRLVNSKLPTVRQCFAHELNERDNIFETIRADYDGFDEWINKCKLQHRHCYIIQERNDSGLAGLTILNPESKAFGLGDKVLKICTFKIADDYQGQKYGELLLKAIFDYCEANQFDACFLTLYAEKQAFLKSFLEDFGFFVCGKSNSQLVLGKRFTPTQEEKMELDTFDYHVKFGPWITRFTRNDSFIIPIQPRFYDRLFPEDSIQEQVFSEPFGNSIRKAYLSNSKIGLIKRGDNVFFYRSLEKGALRALGIVEDVLVSDSVDEIERFVYKISVFEKNYIWSLAAKKVLAIKFRRVKFLRPIPLNDLIEHKVLAGPPQTIQRINRGSLKWLIQRMGL